MHHPLHHTLPWFPGFSLERMPNLHGKVTTTHRHSDTTSQPLAKVVVAQRCTHIFILEYSCFICQVALVTGAACRDEREFDEPDHFDVRRTPDRALYFGHGHHFCIGKSLARLETRIALEEIAARFPNYEVDPAGMTRTYQAHVKGYVNLPISTSR